MDWYWNFFCKQWNVHVEEFYYLAKDHTRSWPLIPTSELGRNTMIKILRKCYVDSYNTVYHLKSSVNRNGIPGQNFVCNAVFIMNTTNRISI